MYLWKLSDIGLSFLAVPVRIGAFVTPGTSAMAGSTTIKVQVTCGKSGRGFNRMFARHHDTVIV